MKELIPRWRVASEGRGRLAAGGREQEGALRFGLAPWPPRVGGEGEGAPEAGGGGLPAALCLFV